MARKAWKATTNIQYGDPGGEKTTFKPGDIVEGLTKDEMSQLWEAGALEETVVADSEEPASTEEGTEAKDEAPQVSSTPAPAVTPKPAAPTEKSSEGGSTEGA